MSSIKGQEEWVFYKKKILQNSLSSSPVKIEKSKTINKEFTHPRWHPGPMLFQTVKDVSSVLCKNFESSKFFFFGGHTR